LAWFSWFMASFFIKFNCLLTISTSNEMLHYRKVCPFRSEHILCGCDNWAWAPNCLLVLLLGMTRRIMITLVTDIYVGLCLFSPWQGIFYMSTLNTLLSATWQGICHGYHCLKCETTHAYGVPHFLCFDHPMHMLQIGDAKHKLGVLKFSGQVLVRQEISVKKYLLCETNFCGLWIRF
jgi:hypothetical protein